MFDGFPAVVVHGYIEDNTAVSSFPFFPPVLTMTIGKLQVTLAILKPDVTKMPLFVEAVRSRLAAEGFQIVRSRQLTMNRTRAEEFYSEHRGRFFHNRLVTFMSSGPIWTHILARNDAIAAWRRLLGPTKVFRAIYEQPDCLRAQFGLTDTRNGFHGSDSPESAAREIAFFFPDFDVADWLKQNDQRVLDASSRVTSSQGMTSYGREMGDGRVGARASEESCVQSSEMDGYLGDRDFDETREVSSSESQKTRKLWFSGSSQVWLGCLKVDVGR